MAEKKIFHSVETALTQTPRAEWPTSCAVSRSLLTCTRVRGIVRQHMLKRGVALAHLEDILSEIALVMQMKMLPKLENITDVYFVIFRVSQLVVSNYGKKAINTSRSEEVSLSSVLDDEDDESGALERLTSDTVSADESDENEKRIDLENAKKRFAEKLSAVGWPKEIKRERTRLGRPPKQNPIQPKA